MGKNVKITLNSAGVRQMLKDPAFSGQCEAIAAAIAGRAGEGYASEPRHYPERHGAAVYPATDGAYFDNLHHNTLLKAVRSS